MPNKSYIPKLSTMKKLIIFALLATAVFSKADNFKSSIEAVKSGKSQTAMAHWWGFNPEDSTKALQAAIDSGVAKVIVKKMSSPWIIRPIKLRSNQEIVFEKDVRVIAKKGAFKPIYDCLFKSVRGKNLTLRGENTKFIMHKKDYHDRKRYKKSEWRHGISLLSCENVIIKGITIKDSGGDGIYVGALNSGQNYCKNIRIEDVVCDGNNRQGISVISAENLFIRNSKLINTAGTAPMAGIDFEPNRPNHRLVNCVVENCEISGNGSSGVTTYIKLDKTAPPVSIMVKKCLINNNKNGITLAAPVGRHSVKAPAKGEIIFENCYVQQSKGSVLEFKNFRSDSFEAVFKNCNFKNTSHASTVEFIATPGISRAMGNVTFKNCSITDKNKKPLIKYTSNYAPGTRLAQINGSITFNNEKIDSANYIKHKGWDKVSEHASVKLELAQLKLLKNTKSSSQSISKDNLLFRSAVGYLFAAEKGQKVTFDLDYRMIRNKKRDMNVILESPAGIKKTFTSAQVNKINHYSFIAEETGVYKASCNPRGNTVNLNKSNTPYSIALPESGFLNFFRPKQAVYFDIPAGVSKIRVLVSGQGTRETVNVVIKVQNKPVAKGDKISSPHLFNVSIKPGLKRRTGIIELNNAVEDVMIKILGPLQPIISVNEKDLVITEYKTAP